MFCYPLSQNEDCKQSSKVTLGEGRDVVNSLTADHKGFIFGDVAIDSEKSGIYSCTWVVV